MSRRTGFGVLVFGLFSLVSASASPCTLVNHECPPGRIRNPTAGLEMFQDIAYNSAQDFFVVAYQAGSARGLTLFPNGSVGGEIVYGPDNVVQDVGIEYNPDRNEFLVVWRYDQPLEVWGRYLTGDGNPIGSPFFIGSGGVEPRIAYSSASQRYIVVFSGIGLGAHYTIVAGDSTSASPLILGKTTIDALAFGARIAYGSVSNKFLIAYVRDFSPPSRADVRGNFLNGNGFGLGGTLSIGTGGENQQYPEVGYASTTDSFMVSYEDWSLGGLPDVQFNLVTSAGSVGARLNLTPGEPSWNVPGPIAFDALNGEFVATYFNGLVSGYTREVKTSGVLDRRTLFGNLNTTPLGITIRNDPEEPMAAVVWRNYLGLDGVHVSFIALDLPPPVITSTVLPAGAKGVSYSQAVPVQGGRPPLAYSLVSGTPPPGLTGPNAATGIISGTPTTIGNFTFRVRVTDNEGRFDEEDLTLAITLAAPTPISPTSTTNDPTPAFQWSASPTATSYTLVVENVTDGGIPINQSGIAATNFTPAAPLASGKIYRWKVQATDGVNLSPFSQQITFEIDSVAPSTVMNLAGGPPVEAVHTGLFIANSSGSLPGYGAERTLDVNLVTEYTSPGRATANAGEHITYDLGASKAVGRVRLHSREFFGNLMPQDFVIELSNSPTSGFTVAHTVTDFVAPVSPGQWFTFNFAPVTGRYLRLRVTEMNAYTNGQFYATFTEFEAYQTAPLGSLILSWSAPSDDLTLPGVGAVVSYDIRYTPGTTFDFPTATPVGFFPLPVPAGSQQTLLVTGLTPEATYRFGLTSTDDAGNVSPVSNVAVAGSKGFPPVAVANLSALNPALNSVQLRWTAPADPPSGGAASGYDVRYSASPITAENFDSALPATLVPATPPSTPGTQETRTVTGLSPNTLYYFALKSADGGNNKSDISNVIAFSTLDSIPPAPVDSLAVGVFDDETVDLSWNATGDDGPLGTATSFDLRYSINPIDESNFSSATAVVGEPAPGPFGTQHTHVVESLAPATLHYVALRVIDEQNNPSAISNVVSFTTLANLAEPLITSPAPGSTLTGSVQTFQWTPNGLAATQWWLYVGSTRGARNIHDSGNLGSAMARTVSGLPIDGSTVWTRLWYYAGVWGYADFQFTAHTPPPPPPPPEITSPAANSTLTGASVPFSWTSHGAAVTEWWLYAGATQGASNYFDSGTLGAATTQVNVTGLPTNGSTVHARLWYRIAGLWGLQDYQYTASTGPGPGNPTITSPAPNSTLAGPAVVFQWTASGAAVTEWWLYVGRSSNAFDIYDSGSLGSGTTQALVSGLPVDGTQVFARLWYRIAGLWQFADFQYTASIGGGGGTPAITSPAPNSTLTAASQLFQWTANGAPVEEWWVYAGSMLGGKNYFDSGSLGAATLQVNATGLATNGSTVHVRLWYRIAALWQFADSQYTAANLQPNIVSPAPGATLTGASQIFQWVQNVSGATEWWFYAGSTQGASNYFDSGSLGAPTVQVNATGLPTNGSTVHVRLWYRIGGLWQVTDSQYTAANLQPNIVSPAPATVLSGASVPFQWTANGVPVTEWWLYAGSTAGGTNYYDSGSLGAATTSATVTGLPTDGSTVHVALWYRVAGLWQFRLFQYTAGP